MKFVKSFFILVLLCFSAQANTIYELIKIPNLEIYNLKNENKLRSLAISEFRNLFIFHIRNSTKLYFKSSLKVSLSASTKVGIRSQIFDNQTKTLFNDFVVVKQKKTIHILNAISPAWTSSFAMAKHICSNFLKL